MVDSALFGVTLILVGIVLPSAYVSLRRVWRMLVKKKTCLVIDREFLTDPYAFGHSQSDDKFFKRGM